MELKFIEELEYNGKAYPVEDMPEKIQSLVEAYNTALKMEREATNTLYIAASSKKALADEIRNNLEKLLS